MHLWDKKVQQIQRNNNQNKRSSSENELKEDEKVLFHPSDWKIERDIVEDDLQVILTPQPTL